MGCRSNPGPHTASGFQDSLGRLFQSVTVPQSSFISHEFNILDMSVILQNAPQFGFIGCFLMIRLRLCIFGKNTQKWLCFLVYHIREYMILMCLSYSSDANLDHLIKVESTGFPHYKVTIFPFAIKKYLEWNTFELSKFFISPHISIH